MSVAKAWERTDYYFLSQLVGNSGTLEPTSDLTTESENDYNRTDATLMVGEIKFTIEVKGRERWFTYRMLNEGLLIDKEKIDNLVNVAGDHGYVIAFLFQHNKTYKWKATDRDKWKCEQRYLPVKKGKNVKKEWTWVYLLPLTDEHLTRVQPDLRDYEYVYDCSEKGITPNYITD